MQAKALAYIYWDPQPRTNYAFSSARALKQIQKPVGDTILSRSDQKLLFLIAQEEFSLRVSETSADSYITYISFFFVIFSSSGLEQM